MIMGALEMFVIMKNIRMIVTAPVAILKMDRKYLKWYVHIL